MSRTFLINAPVTTTVTPETTLLNMPNDLDLTSVAQPNAKPAPLTIALTEILGEPSRDVAFSVLGSFTSSLNLMLVSRCRLAIEARGTTRDEMNDAPSIDQRNDSDDEAGTNSACYEQGSIEEASAAYAGNRTPMPAREVAKRLAVIRSYCHIRQEALRTSSIAPFIPRSLNESIDFLRSQQPAEATAADLIIRIASQASGGLKTPKQCAADRNAEIREDRITFEAIAPEMVLMGDSLTANYEPDERAVEEAFDGLPAQIKVNVYTAACNALVTAFNSAYKELMKRGKLSRGGDMVIAQGLHKRGINTLHAICTKNAVELNEFEQRGGQLKELKHLG